MRVGFVGWRGMVGSVLVQRMLEERDFELIDPVFFSTSSAGGAGPAIGRRRRAAARRERPEGVHRARRDRHLPGRRLDQRDATRSSARRAGRGHWIDAACALRMKDDAIIILDPVNRDVIDAARQRGVKDCIGGNCTVSLMLMGLAGPVPARPRRVDDLHDLPGRVRRGRAEHARAARADGRGAPRGEGAARGSGVVDPRHRPRGRRHPARRRASRPSTSASRSPAA